jgi:periplasmic divalent cation tolerance protein
MRGPAGRFAIPGGLSTHPKRVLIIGSKCSNSRGLRPAGPAPVTKHMSDQVILALTTCPDEASAQALAAALVQERLATCVNRISGVRSTYFWDARLQDEAEILLIIKTTAGRLDDLRTRLTALHPYELPELLAIDVAGGNERYLDWVRMGVRNKGE